jgi:hypothetical protein
MSMLKKRLVLDALVIITLLAWVLPAEATTIIPQSFSELVDQADLVIEGVVVDLRVVSTGSDLSRQEAKTSGRSPQVEEKPNRVDGVQPVEREQHYLMPEGLPVESGRMLFTEVTIEVEQAIVGSTGSRVTFRVAGGSDDTHSVEVFGMPSFRHGNRYLLFLRPHFETTGVPIVGVNQGFFEVVVQSDGGEKIVLDHKGDYVLGIEHDELIVRHNAERSRHPVPTLGPAPVPDNPYEVEARVSPAVQRYWESQEPPLSLEAFVEVVASRVEVQQ